MKVLKMHDNADGKFDQFVKEQLDKTDVDMALADQYFAQMQLPAAQQAIPPKRRWRWFWIWFSASCLIGISIYIFTATDKRAPATLPANGTTTASRPTPSQAGETPTTANKAGEKAFVESPVAKQSTIHAIPANNNPFNKILTDTQAAFKKTTLSVDTNQQTTITKIEPSVTIKDTLQRLTAQKDSVVKARQKTVVPPKPKDSVYIVW